MATSMSQQTSSDNLAVHRGFIRDNCLPCPLCGCMGCIMAPAGDLAGVVDDFFCEQCKEAFTGDHVRVVITQWSAYLAWVATAPARKD